jgi:hypothetical protein
MALLSRRWAAVYCHPGPRMAGSDPYGAERSLRWQAPKLLVPDVGAEYLGTSFLASASV